MSKTPKPVKTLNLRPQELEDLLSAIGLARELAEVLHADSPLFRKALKKLDERCRTLAGYGRKA